MNLIAPLTIDLSGRAAVVTGGSGELGRVICRTLAQCGAAVAVHYHRNRDAAEKVVDSIIGNGGQAKAFSADVGDLDHVFQLRSEVAEWNGDAGIVVNNAVIQYEWKSVLDQDAADYESQFRSCVLQNVHMAKAFVPPMIERGIGGRIIAINTECAMQNAAYQSAYVSGKRGMDGVLKVLAKEIGPHQITVNQVAPGWTVSDRIRALRDDPQGDYIKSVPLARAGTDQEIANLVAFLASDLASFITGAFIPVCGGNVMSPI